MTLPAVTIPATRNAGHARADCEGGAARRFDDEARRRVAARASRL